MIGSLRGQVKQRDEGTIVVDVGGVGYELQVSLSVLTGGAEVGAEVDLFVFTDVRENDISLYGFTSKAEKELFLLLRKVKGVGSKLALAIISQLAPDELLGAIGSSDVTALTKISGIGKKTAERLVVELRENVGEMARGARVIPNHLERTGVKVIRQAQDGERAIIEDVVLALERLGFTGDRVSVALDASTRELSENNPAALKDSGELLKHTLIHL